MLRSVLVQWVAIDAVEIGAAHLLAIHRAGSSPNALPSFQHYHLDEIIVCSATGPQAPHFHLSFPSGTEYEKIRHNVVQVISDPRLHR